MMQRILNSKNFVAFILAAATGMTLYFHVPFPDSNIFLRVMALRSPSAFEVLDFVLAARTMAPSRSPEKR